VKIIDSNCIYHDRSGAAIENSGCGFAVLSIQQTAARVYGFDKPVNPCFFPGFARSGLRTCSDQAGRSGCRRGKCLLKRIGVFSCRSGAADRQGDQFGRSRRQDKYVRFAEKSGQRSSCCQYFLDFAETITYNYFVLYEHECLL
jgi:hypothetical protein